MRQPGGGPFDLWGKTATYIGAGFLKKYCEGLQRDMIAAIARQPVFRVPCTFAHLKSLVKDYLGYGNKMGEGWLLTGEMLELIDSGTSNIVCTQPFACLPNHVVGKEWCGRSKPSAAGQHRLWDYDPGATRINQEKPDQADAGQCQVGGQGGGGRGGNDGGAGFRRNRRGGASLKPGMAFSRFSMSAKARGKEDCYA